MNIANSIPLAKYAERKERNPRVAVFDHFAERNEAPSHGDQVEDIIMRTTGLDDRKIQNYQNVYSRKTSEEDVFESTDSKTKFKETLRSYTIETVNGFLDATNQWSKYASLPARSSSVHKPSSCLRDCGTKVFTGKVAGKKESLQPRTTRWGESAQGNSSQPCNDISSPVSSLVHASLATNPKRIENRSCKLIPETWDNSNNQLASLGSN